MIKRKLKQYFLLTKFRLSFTVMISALAGYLFNGGTSWKEATILCVGGLLITCASNASNQIWERNLDAKMKRTMKRPLPSGDMSVTEAVIAVILFVGIGLWMLATINWPTFLLGLFGYVSYVFAYTPTKRVSPWAVFVGAFPGAVPPMIGAVAASGVFSLVPGALFFIQFIWQFPHFWAIAWVAHDDYNAGGFSLLPSRTGRSKASAFQIALYCLVLIPFSLLPWLFGWTGNISMILITLIGGVFYWYAYKLYQTLEIKDAKRLMFASFIYLPIIQFILVFDRTETFLNHLSHTAEITLF
ncbi:MAG: heme o synthase [Crocinitomicaceae bacterium]|nr:heme o synthase [Crocinitomicaceae bacterium]